MITAITRKISFASVIFLSTFYIYENLIDVSLWWFGEEEKQYYKDYQKYWETLYDLVLPYILAGISTIKYILKAFAIDKMKTLLKRSAFWYGLSALTALVGLVFQYI